MLQEAAPGAPADTSSSSGIIDERDEKNLKTLLIEHFALNETQFSEFIRDFKLVGWFDGSDDDFTSYTQFETFNIKNNFDRFVFELDSNLPLPDRRKLLTKYVKIIDYKKEFNLESDSILSFQEVTQTPPRGARTRGQRACSTRQ